MITKRGNRKLRRGTVVSDKMNKTIVVKVERKLPHPIYRKIIREKHKFKVHDPENKAHIGDMVEIMETRPLSKEKRWRLVKVVKKTEAGEVSEKGIVEAVE